MKAFRDMFVTADPGRFGRGLAARLVRLVEGNEAMLCGKEVGKGGRLLSTFSFMEQTLLLSFSCECQVIHTRGSPR